MAAIAAFAVTCLTSCMTINSSASVTNTPIGTKVGEAKSSIILGIWSTKGKEATLKQACINGGISKINHVEYETELYCGGIVIDHIVRVYGE